MISNVVSSHVPFGEGESPVPGNSSNQNASAITEKKIIVGFEEEARQLQNILIGGWKTLEVVPIIGMAGIGKTTLANKLFNDPSIVKHFHVRSWTSVSQLYQHRKLLCDILYSIVNENDPVFALEDEDIGQKLYQCLKGKRYLIVIDDIWDISAWNDIELYFPKNECGSRVLVTSRTEGVASKIILSRPPCFLRFLTEGESSQLFQNIVDTDKNIPLELIEIGKQIVEKCKGLPLAIVVIAGILAKEEKTQDLWFHVSENMGRSISNDLDQLMNTLALSYDRLPPSMKSCFLYLASFPEDHEISVRRLTKSWISEGFIQKSADMSCEDVAESYLGDLVCRSLLMIAKRRSDGGIKSCRIHDLLRDLCIKKAEEKRFASLVCKCGSNGTPSRPKIILSKLLDNRDDRGFDFSDCQHFHFYDSLSIYPSELCTPGTLSVYRLIRVLDLRHMTLDQFPEEILQLLHLKYLALLVDTLKDLPAAVFELWNLETFIIEGEKGKRISLPFGLLKMVNLRHLQSSRELVCHFPLHLALEKLLNLEHGKAAVLHNLQTISQVCPSSFTDNLLPRTLNLRKLGLHMTFSETLEPFSFPDLSSLCQLRTLKFEYQTYGMVPFHLPLLHKFPTSLAKLTLIGSFDWGELESISLLPNLEVLKIKNNFVSGSMWETIENGFQCLKYLKLSHVDLQQWVCEASHFPRLQYLLLNGCLALKEIPSELGEVITLQTIEIFRSSVSAVESSWNIQESQEELGNHNFKVCIYDRFEEY